MAGKSDPILELIRKGDLQGAEAALVQAIAGTPEDDELKARLEHVRTLLTSKARTEAAPSSTPSPPQPAAQPATIRHTPQEPTAGARSWTQTGAVVIAILVAGYWIAHRSSAPPPARASSPVAQRPSPVPLARPPAPRRIAIEPVPPVDEEPLAPKPEPPTTTESETMVVVEESAPLPTHVDEATVVPCIRNGAPGCLVEVSFRSGRVNLQVDTGADITMLTVEGARRAGLTWDKSNPVITMNGVAGRTSAVLLRTAVAVGAAKEEDVIVTVAPISLGRSEGLLGMTFFERYRSSIGHDELRLVPIDANETPRPGGHGRSWWSQRFRSNVTRLEGLERMVGLARSADRQINSMFGVDPNADTFEGRVQRYRKFAEAEHEELMTSAARSAVPVEWRR